MRLEPQNVVATWLPWERIQHLRYPQQYPAISLPLVVENGRTNYWTKPFYQRLWPAFSFKKHFIYWGMRNRSLSNLFQCGYPNSSPASMVTMESLWSAGIKGNPETDQRPKHLTGKQLASLNQWRFEAWFKRLSNSLGWFNSGSMSKKDVIRFQ